MKRIYLLVVISICSSLALVGCKGKQTVNSNTSQVQHNNTAQLKQNNTQVDTKSQDEKNKVGDSSIKSKEGLKVYVFSTGDSDTSLIVDGKTAMLIDGGDADDGDLLVGYIKKLGIKRLKYVIITHGHSDDTGGIPKVLSNIPVDYIFAPEHVAVKKEVVSELDSTKKDTKFINFITSHNLYMSMPKENFNYKLDKAYFTVMNTNGGSSLDEASLVVNLINGNDKMLFMGDAGVQTEKELLSKFTKVDLLKVGNHGISTGTTKEFLDKIKPTYSVIQVSGGRDGSPNEDTITRLKNVGSKVYRTDKAGHVVFISTGDGIVTENKILE